MAPIGNCSTKFRGTPSLRTKSNTILTPSSPAGLDGTDGIYTFGGDRETFNPFDPLNFQNVDNDVWSFALVPEPSALVLCILGMFACAAKARNTAHCRLMRSKVSRMVTLPW